MSNQPRRTAFWVIFVVLVAIGLWWLLYVPYRPGAVFAAIPADATTVLVSRNLAGELPVLLRNPAVHSMLNSLGASDEDIAKVVSNRQTRAWIEQLASRETVLAYVPALGYQRKPAWVFASWIGGRSQRLRWQLQWFRSSDLRPLHLDFGRTVWVTRTKLPQPGQRLSLALTEGLVLGCVSADPAGVRWLIETGDGHPTRPSVLASGAYASATAIAPTNLALWGWHRPAAPGADTSTFKPGLAAFGIEATRDGRLRLPVVIDQALPHADPFRDRADVKSLASLLGSSPDAIIVLPLGWADSLFPPNPQPLWADPVQRFISPEGAPTNSLAFVALLNREHSGRIRSAFGKSAAMLIGKGLRVPTIVMGLQVRDERDAAIRMKNVIESLNARYGWALTMQATELEGRAVTLVADAGNSFYGKFSPEEQVAFVVLDNWLILASNLSSLKRRLDARVPGAEAPWLTDSPSSHACAWADLERCGKTLKDALAAAQLATMVSSSGTSTNSRAAWEDARKWIAAAEGLKQLAIAMEAADGVTKASAVIGR